MFFSELLFSSVAVFTFFSTPLARSAEMTNPSTVDAEKWHIPFIKIRRTQEGCGGLWRRKSDSKSSSAPAGAASFPAAVFLTGKCPNLCRDGISCCRKIGESFSSSVENLPENLSSMEFRTATAFSSVLKDNCQTKVYYFRKCFW